MKEFFEIGVRYNRPKDDGFSCRVSELYLVKACSFAEAEACITKQFVGLRPDADFEVVTVKRSNISELSINQFKKENSGDNKFYKIKVNWITIDEKTSADKRIPMYYLVYACSLAAAHSAIREYLAGSLSDFDVATVDESKIVGVYGYTEV